MGKNREEKKEVFAMDIIAAQAQEMKDALWCICHELRSINEFLREVKSFEITGEGMSTSALAIVVGTTRIFDLTDIPSGSVLPAGVIPAWTSSDTANTSLTPSADGLKCAVAVGASAPVPGGFNLTVSATLPDGTTPTSGPQPVAYQAAPVVEPASFGITEEPAS
jgi:hypothetical protein